MLKTVGGLESQVWAVLETIEDPELPISVIDLGMIDGVDVAEGAVRITLVPTYSACPAVEMIRQRIRDAVAQIPSVSAVTVDLSFARPWTLERMSEHGRELLRHHGLSVSRTPTSVTCPFCGSTNTVLENPFGPTLCRAIYYCNDCKNPIERFKPPLDR